MIELNKIYNEPCEETMKRMEDGSIDLTVTSPPYDKLRDYNGFAFDINTVAPELFRVTSRGGVVVWVVSDQTINGAETGSSFRQALRFMEAGFNLHDTMIYGKPGIRFPDQTRYHQVWEFMFVFSKGSPKTVNLLKDKPNLWRGDIYRYGERQTDGSMKYKEKTKVGGDMGVRYNIWVYDSGFMKSTADKVAFEHPAIFPEQLAGDHIRSWSNPGDIIYDPFSGSGTTAKMALALQRKYIGSEISAEYCEIARKRLNKLLVA